MTTVRHGLRLKRSSAFLSFQTCDKMAWREKTSASRVSLRSRRLRRPNHKGVVSVATSSEPLDNRVGLPVSDAAFCGDNRRPLNRFDARTRGRSRGASAAHAEYVRRGGQQWPSLPRLHQEAKPQGGRQGHRRGSGRSCYTARGRGEDGRLSPRATSRYPQGSHGFTCTRATRPSVCRTSGRGR